MPRCDRQYWAEFSNSYSQHLRYLAKAKRRTSASLNASSRQNGTCSHLRGGANMCRVGIKDARRSSQIESSKTPFASISFRVGNGLTSEKMSFAHFPVLRYLNNLGSKPRQRVNLVELTGCATHALYASARALMYDINVIKTQVTLHFHQSIGVAATNLNICVTLLKRICRLHGLQRWPGRKVSSP